MREPGCCFCDPEPPHIRLGFYMSKCLRFLNKAFGHAARRRTSGAQLAGNCNLAISFLETIPAQKFTSKSMTMPFLIFNFSDGAMADGKPSAGAVCYDPASMTTQVAEFSIPEPLKCIWANLANNSYIFQIEAWAALFSKWQWASLTSNAPVLHCNDNESARWASAKACLDSQSMDVLARVYQALELSCPSLTCFERVASFSNPANMPSRGMLAIAAQELESESRGHHRRGSRSGQALRRNPTADQAALLGPGSRRPWPTGAGAKRAPGPVTCPMRG